MSTSLEPQSRSGLVLQSRRDPTPVNLEQWIPSDQPQPSGHVLKAIEESSIKHFPWREISATRQFPRGCGRNVQCISTDKISSTRAFPPSCGRNAQPFSAEEHQKSVSSEKGNSVDCRKNILEPSPSEKTVKNEANHAEVKVWDGYACRHSQMDGSHGPCRQGKQVAIHNSSSAIGINIKKHKFMAVENSISASDEKKLKTENSRGLTTEKKVPPRAIKMLNLYRNIFKEEVKKLKEKGNLTKRIDMLAFDRLKETDIWVNPGTAILGSIPGVEVGDKFQYRVELLIVGLHRHLQAGIDYLNKGGKIIATSIVASGGYDNDTSDSDVLIYSGQGGNPRRGDQPHKNQKLEGGNLALKNSMKEKNFVRVIFGSEEVQDSDFINARGKIVSYYVYSGFYLVENYWQKTGDYGNVIFKFQLRRIPGQCQLQLHSRKN